VPLSLHQKVDILGDRYLGETRVSVAVPVFSYLTADHLVGILVYLSPLVIDSEVNETEDDETVTGAVLSGLRWGTPADLDDLADRVATERGKLADYYRAVARVYGVTA
jgi:hypothetical protein